MKVSMTREEAAKWLEETIQDTDTYFSSCSEALQKEIDEQKEVFLLALSALRPVSRERVEKVWRGCEWCNGEHSNNGEISAYAEVECDGCDAGDDCPNSHSSEDPCYGLVDRALPVNFCPVCGKPKTDEAVDMVMERLEDLHEEN